MIASKLGDFEGHEVLAATVAITNAGDGLSKAIAVNPVLLDLGDKVHVVLECEVTKIAFDAIKDTGTLQRIHTLRAGAATLIDEKQVRKALDRTQDAIDKNEGKNSFPGMSRSDMGPPDDPGDMSDPDTKAMTGAKAPAAKKAAAAKKATKAPAAKKAPAKKTTSNGSDLSVVKGGKPDGAAPEGK